MSEQQRIIKSVICASCEHMTAEQIFFEARRHMPSISLGTVYRNLKQMSDTGEIKQIHIAEGPDRYDKNTGPHEHMQCIKCGALDDLLLPELLPLLLQKSAGKVLSYDLQLSYICPRCENKA